MVHANAGHQANPSLVTVSHFTYLLHAVGLAIGAFGAATVVGSFVFGWPSIIAVIINYVKRPEMRGTWLESHVTWQIRTFWWALFWTCVIGLTGFVLAIVLVGFGIWAVGFSLLGLWAIYRITRGWLALQAGRPVP
jgi:uncharacterized membrane protein